MVRLLKRKPAMTVVVDRKTHVVRLTRTIHAPKLRVFEAWSQPNQLAMWWDPCGKPLAICEINLKKGGSFRFVNQDRPGMPFTGKYVEIRPPDRIIFETALGTGRVLLSESKGMTTMTVEIECASDEALERLLEQRIDEGTSATLEKLAQYLEG